jgi:hypothetical protein
VTPTTPSLDDVHSAKDWERLGLSDSGRRAASAAIEAMLTDRAGELLPPAADWVARVVRSYDLSIGACSLQVRLGVRVLVALLEWLPLVVLGEASRMSRLPLKRRIDYLEALEAHAFAPLTMLLVATKVPMLVPAFESGEPLRLTGYDRETTASRRKLPMTKERSA